MCSSVATALLTALVLAGCQSTPRAPSPSAQATTPAPAAAQPVAPAPPPAPLVPRSDAEIRQLLDSARSLLDQGQSDAAAIEVRKALASDPTHRIATSLLRQITEDPLVLYGRESFAYRVGYGDGLAAIAQRFMGDRDQFWGLARYNHIASPRLLAVGQTIRIPGTAPRVMPPPVAAPSAPAAVAPAPAAPVVEAPPPAPAPAPAQTAATAAANTAQAVSTATRRARTAMARQDVCGAIRWWDEVLRLEPGNRTAPLEREKAITAKVKLGGRC